MLTAKRAFPGVAVADTLAAVMRGEPDWTALPAGTPPALRTLLRRCLEKDRARRLADIADARLEIDDLLTGRTEPAAERHDPLPAPAVRSKPHRGRSLAVPAFVAGVIFVAVIARLALDRQPDAEPQVVAPRLSPPAARSRDTAPAAPLSVESSSPPAPAQRFISPPDGVRWAHAMDDNVPNTILAMSPDGRLLVYSGEIGDERALASIPYVRRRMAAAGNGGRYFSFLVARQQVHRIFCRSHVEAGGSGRPRHTHARRKPDFFADHSDASGEPARRHMGS